MSARFALTVQFEVAVAGRARFLRAVQSNAAQTVAEDAGCLRFDALAPVDDPAAVWLHEIYRDRNAFDAHLTADHYQRFDAETRPKVRRKVVTLLALSENGKT